MLPPLPRLGAGYPLGGGWGGEGHSRAGVILALQLLLLLMTTASAAAAPVAAQTPALPTADGGPGAVYLALGDSVAAGIGASRPLEGGYAAVLAGYLDRQLGHPVQRLNLAVPGETSTSLLAGRQLASALAVVETAARDRFRLNPITITIGANDLLRAAPEPAARAAALRAVAANLRRLLAHLRAAAGDTVAPPPDVVVTGYYDLTGSPAALPGTDGWWLVQLDATLAREARRAGARWVDVAPLFRGRETDLTWYPSDIHPTNAGHRTIADAIWRTLAYDADPPSIRIERPAAGPLPRPVPTLAAVVADRVGVTQVTFAVDGQPVGELPYLPDLAAHAALWDTRRVPPGPHTLQVRARDAAGNEATASVVVEVLPTTDAAPDVVAASTPVVRAPPPASPTS